MAEPIPHLSHPPHHHHHHEEADGLPVAKFAIAVIIQLALAIAVFALAFPQMFRAEIAQPGWLVLAAFLFGFPLSLFEYLYHRYLLHSATLPFMASMHRAHSEHHGLTAVKAPVTPKEPERMVPVKSEYPVEHKHQEASQMFPLFSLSIFYPVFFLLMGLPAKLIFPNAPIVMGLIVAVTIYYCAYEIWHAILHLPYEKFWEPKMQAKRTGRIVRFIYSFHLMHHWRPVCNVAVVGLWGLALWDHAFRTHRRPYRVPVNGAEVNYLDIELKKPLWPISMLDKWQGPMYKTSRKIESFLARIFLRRTRA